MLIDMENRMFQYGTLNPGVIFEYNGEQLVVTELQDTFFDEKSNAHICFYHSFYIFTGRIFQPFQSSEDLYNLYVQVPFSAIIETIYDEKGVLN